MTTQTTNNDDGDETPRPRSRLEREVAEILERKDREPISFADEAQRRKRTSRPEPHVRPSGQADPRAWFDRLGSGRYLLVAIAAAVLALIVRDVSPLLANILAIVCVAAIFFPVVQQFRQPQAPDTKTWRGRDVSSSLSRPAGLERLFDRFRRPPRI